MALVYPGSAAIPQYESSLAKFLPAFEKGQSERKDSDAFDAAAKAFGKPGSSAPKEQNFLERLLGFGQEQPAAQQAGPFTRPQVPPNAVDSIDAAAPQTPAQRAIAAETRPINGMTMDSYIANARTAESGGNDAARNPNSSATGRYQFLDSTWNGLAQKYPELGLTADGRTDPAQQERAMARFTQDNAGALQQAGIPVNPGTLYAAHFLGAGGATKALSADPATPMSAVVDPAVIEANPQLRGQTVADFAQWANGKGGNQSGGYQPPMRDEGAGQGQPFQPDEGTMRTLLASEATRPLAMSLIKAQQDTQASQGRFVTEQGQDGGIWQRDTLTGERNVLQQPGGDLDREYKRAQIDALQAKPAVTPTDDQREYELAKSQGFPGTFLEFKAAQRANTGLSIKTNPDGTTEIVQGDLSGMPKTTEGQSKDVGYLTRGAGANEILSTLDSELTNVGGAVAGAVPGGNFVQSESYQKANQAGLEFLAALLRKDSGGAITPDENRGYGDIYLPRPGDKPGVIEQKRAARQRALSAIELGLPATVIKAMEEQGVDLSGARIVQPTAAPQPAPAAPPAPTDLPVPQGVVFSSKEQYDAAPSGTVYIAPDGTTRTKP